jgi:hypothetical protein
MRKTLFWLVAFLVSGLKERRALALENLALRQQLAVLKRSNARPRLRSKDRFFWIGLSQVWQNWREALVIVKPDTVVGWHRRGFRVFWRWISRRSPSGRPATNPKIRALILLRDRDKIYGEFFQQRVESMDIEEILTAPHSSWQSPYVERLIGSIRRECLDHVVVLGEQHWRRLLKSYFQYYQDSFILGEGLAGTQVSSVSRRGRSYRTAPSRGSASSL